MKSVITFSMKVIFAGFQLIFGFIMKLISKNGLQRRIQREARGARPPLPRFSCIHLIFCDHFEELQTVFIEVKLIINNTPLTYVYPNTIKTYLTPNHLLFGIQLICCSNTASTPTNICWSSRRLEEISQNVLKTSSRRLGRRKIVTLKTS